MRGGMEPHRLRSGGLKLPPYHHAAGQRAAGHGFDVVVLETDGASEAEGAERAPEDGATWP